MFLGCCDPRNIILYDNDKNAFAWMYHNQAVAGNQVCLEQNHVDIRYIFGCCDPKNMFLYHNKKRVGSDDPQPDYSDRPGVQRMLNHEEIIYLLDTLIQTI